MPVSEAVKPTGIRPPPHSVVSGLGTDTKTTSIMPNPGSERRFKSRVRERKTAAERVLAGRVAIKRRYAAQDTASRLLPSSRVRDCSRYLGYRQEHVQVWFNPEHKSARYSGLAICGSVWQCPVCATKITEARRKELSLAISAWRQAGGSVLMVTYTISHRKDDSLAELLEGLKKARSRVTSGRAAQELYARYGVEGSIRSLEVTHGANGWHPHIHELLFTWSMETDIAKRGADQDNFLSALRSRWEVAVTKSGLREVNEHGVSLMQADLGAAEYVAKFGCERSWAAEQELTKQPVKVSKSLTGRSPMELLMCCSEQEDHEAGRLWTEYARTMHGKRQLFWSRGLRAKVFVDMPEFIQERTDEELANDVDTGGIVLLELTRAEWGVVLANDARGQLLSIAATGSVIACLDFLAGLQYSYLVDFGAFDIEGLEADNLGLSAWELAEYRRGGLSAIANPMEYSRLVAGPLPCRVAPL